jgi:hypothetical protein
MPVGRFWLLCFAPVLLGCVGSISSGPGEGPAGTAPGSSSPGPQGPGTTSDPGIVTGGRPNDLLPPNPGTAGCQESAPAVVAARRLTRDQYMATVRDLLGDTRDLSDRLPADDKGEEVFTSPETLIVTPAWADKALSTAEDLAKTATAGANLGKLLPCQPSAGQESACAGQFIKAFGKRAFRRPLSDDEIGGLTKVYEVGASDGFGRGIEMVIAAVLQSPSFLYRLELGQKAGSVGGAVKLTGYELASRLSYFAWGTMPDEALFSAAEAGRLDSPEGIEQEVVRLLKDARGKAMLLAFHQRWFGLDTLAENGKDVAVYPQFDEKLVASMEGEFDAVINDVMGASGDGKIETLLLSDRTFVDASLAGLYGVTAPGGTGLMPVTLPATRKGLLSTVSVLSTHTLSDASSAIHRGKFIRERLLCTVPPDPPAGLMVMPPEPKPGLTTRERLGQHTMDPSCAGCHQMMDPIGFAFENFDGIGRYRTMEQGKKIDASGSLSNTDVDGAFVGPVELAQKLAGSKQVRECVMTTLLSFAQGPQPADACLMTKLNQAFDTSGHDVRALIVAIARSDSFRYRRQLPGEVLP